MEQYCVNGLLREASIHNQKKVAERWQLHVIYASLLNVASILKVVHGCKAINHKEDGQKVCSKPEKQLARKF